jgi:hypothetical protein
MALNFNQMQTARPTLQHGAVAASRVPFIAANDTQALAQAAAQLGFTSIGQDQFQHVDGSWLAMVNGRLERGHQNTLFRGVPQDLTQLPVLPVGQQVAAQKIPPVASPSLLADLTRAGFTETVKSFFASPDGSWVAILPDRGVIRGLQQSQLDPTDLAAPAAGGPTRAQQGGAADGGASAAAPVSPDDVLRAPYVARAARFEDGFLACASVPFLNPGSVASDRATLAQHGFTEEAPGFFVHPDSSFISYTSQGRIERGVDKTLFQRVPQSPQRLGTTPPPRNGYVLAVADSALQKLTFADVRKSDQALLDAGFTKKAPNFYAHADGSFFAFTATKTFTGQASQLFASPPPSFDSMPRQASRPEHGFYAIVKTGALTGAEPNLGQILGGHGFSATVPGRLYEHQDGSFVVVDKGALHRGHGGTLFSDVPQPPAPGTYQVYTRKPAGSWAQWQSQFAIAKCPLFNGQFTSAQAQKILHHLGFHEASPGEWAHPDGSALTLRGDPPYFHASRFQQWDFSQFPYQAGNDGRTLSSVTQRWQAWVQGGGSPPF